MKKHLAVFSLAFICFLGLVKFAPSHAAIEPGLESFQYATIQWAGSAKDIYVVRPDAKMDLYGGRLGREKAPDGAEERGYFMNLVMNMLGKEGYEFAGMTENQIVMKRGVRH